MDDAFALGLILASPELELRAVTTSGGQTEDRAWLACRFLTQCGKAGIPVAAGAEPQAKSEVNDQIQYRRHPAAIFNRTLKPVKEPAAEVLFAELKKQPGEITVVAIGPLTNIARLLTDHPDSAKLMKGLVIMGGSVFAGYSGKAPAEPEWNIKLDVAAAKKVLESGVPLTIVPLDATALAKVPPEEQQKLFAAGRPLAWQVANLLELWNQPVPTLFDPVAVASLLRPGRFRIRGAAAHDERPGADGGRQGKAECPRRRRRETGAACPLDHGANYLCRRAAVSRRAQKRQPSSSRAAAFRPRFTSPRTTTPTSNAAGG